MKHLFVYGSLMYDQVWNKLIRQRYAKRTAILPGYQRFCVKGESYPGLIELANHETQGQLILNVRQPDIDKLDRFEGDYYLRKKVEVLVNQESYFAEVYVFRQRYRHLLSQQVWDENIFQSQGLGLFLRRYTGF